MRIFFFDRPHMQQSFKFSKKFQGAQILIFFVKIGMKLPFIIHFCYQLDLGNSIVSHCRVTICTLLQLAAENRMRHGKSPSPFSEGEDSMRGQVNLSLLIIVAHRVKGFFYERLCFLGCQLSTCAYF